MTVMLHSWTIWNPNYPMHLLFLLLHTDATHDDLINFRHEKCESFNVTKRKLCLPMSLWNCLPMSQWVSLILLIYERDERDETTYPSELGFLSLVMRNEPMYFADNPQITDLDENGTWSDPRRKSNQEISNCSEEKEVISRQINQRWTREEQQRRRLPVG